MVETFTFQNFQAVEIIHLLNVQKFQNSEAKENPNFETLVVS